MKHGVEGGDTKDGDGLDTTELDCARDDGGCTGQCSGDGGGIKYKRCLGGRINKMRNGIRTVKEKEE